MKTGQFRLILIPIIALLLLTASLLGCGTVKNSEAVWWIDPNGQFHTNDIILAQHEIPFTIILPSYLPSNINPYEVRIVGPFKDSFHQGVEIEISYINGDDRIYISEQNNRLIMTPTEELDPIYHDIAGIKVLQQKAQLAGNSEITEGLVFDWNQNGLTLSVRVFDISEDEGIKIVESMINQ